MKSSATAIAHSNIALIKYWGKADEQLNLPAVPSLSMTLDALRTRTTVSFDPALDADVVWLDGSPASEKASRRVVALLDRVRALAGNPLRARVDSANDFPTAAGLASSASGFAALALAAVRALDLDQDFCQISAIARQSSVSAARSLYGGFVSLAARGRCAERLEPEPATATPHAPPASREPWPLVMLVALTVRGPKAIGSTEGMLHTARTSPYFPAWVEAAPGLYEEARRAVLARSLPALGEAMEHSTLLMHASMLAARPALSYLAPATVAAMARVVELRAQGTPCYFTMDAGPHVKVLAAEGDALRVRQALEGVAGVERVIPCRPGPDAHLESSEGAGGPPEPSR